MRCRAGRLRKFIATSRRPCCRSAGQLLFDVDQDGRPAHFWVQNASEPVWGGEAIELVRGWRFKPGVKSGVPVVMPCTLELVWGQRDLSASVLAQLSAATRPQSPPPPDVFPPPAAGIHRIRIDGAIQALRLITTVTPEYPQPARQARVEGAVRFYALIGPDGHVRDLRPITGHPLLVPAATESAGGTRARAHTLAARLRCGSAACSRVEGSPPPH